MKYIVSKEKIIASMKLLGIKPENIEKHLKQWVNDVDGKEAVQTKTYSGEKIWVCEDKKLIIHHEWIDKIPDA